MIPEWREHLDALERSNASEAQRLRAQPANYSLALAWMSEAWELADRYGRERDPAADLARRLQELTLVRQALRHVRLES